MNGLVFQIEWRLALADPRALAFRVLTPLAVVVIIATGALPAGAVASTYVILFLGSGLLRAAESVIEEGRSGLARRVVRGGIPSASYLLQRAAAVAVTTMTFLLPALAVVALSVRAAPLDALVALAALALSLWIACVFGVLVGAVSNSMMEGLVLGGVAFALLLHVSGVFRTPEPNGLGAALEEGSPFRLVHEAFARMGSGGAAGGAFASAAWAVLLPPLAGVLAAKLTARSARIGVDA